MKTFGTKALLVVGTLLLLGVPQLRAQGPPINGTAQLSLSPAPGQGPVGSNFQVSVLIDLRNVTGNSPSNTPTPAVLGGYQIDVNFDTSRLRLDAVGGGTATGFMSAPTATNLSTANANGRVTIAAAQTNDSAPTGLVHVATLTFNGTNNGTAALSVAPRSLSSAAQGGAAGPTNIPGAGSATSIVIGGGPPPTLGTPANPNPPNGATNVSMPVTLSWDAVPTATGYDVYFGTTNNPPLLGRTATNQMPVTTSEGTLYFWRVVAIGPNNTTAGGPLWQFTTSSTTPPPPPPPPPPPGPVPCDPPGKPPSISAPATVASGATYEVSWAPAAGATEYTVDESTDSTFPEDKTTSRTFKDATLRTSFGHTVSVTTTFYYRVRTHRNVGSCDVAGATSDVKQVVVTGPPTPQPAAARILPVVGSTPGAFGSFFKTSMQMHNRTAGLMTGRIIFRKQGQPGSDSDPATTYSIDPGKTLSFADFLPTFDQSGLGSLDIIPTSSATPVILARIYNDAGASGTTGMGMELMDPDQDAIRAGQTGLMFAPIDMQKFRYNIGVRTIAATTMTVRVLNADRGETLTVTKTFAPNFFVQQGVNEFLGSDVLLPNDTLEFRVSAGSAIIYATTTDNTTQDPSIQFATRIGPASNSARTQKQGTRK